MNHPPPTTKTRIILDGVELQGVLWYSLDWDHLYFEANLLTAGPALPDAPPTARLCLDLESAFGGVDTLHLTSRRHRF